MMPKPFSANDKGCPHLIKKRQELTVSSPRKLKPENLEFRSQCSPYREILSKKATGENQQKEREGGKTRNWRDSAWRGREEEMEDDRRRGEEKRGENVQNALSEVLVLIHDHLSMALGATYWLQNLINCGQLH